MSNDPIEYNEEDNTWGFWDETWSHYYGGYETEALARSALREYAKSL